MSPKNPKEEKSTEEAAATETAPTGTIPPPAAVETEFEKVLALAHEIPTTFPEAIRTEMLKPIVAMAAQYFRQFCLAKTNALLADPCWADVTAALGRTGGKGRVVVTVEVTKDGPKLDLPVCMLDSTQSTAPARNGHTVSAGSAVPVGPRADLAVLQPDIVRRFGAGESQAQIAAALNLDARQVWGVLNRAGLVGKPRA